MQPHEPTSYRGRIDTAGRVTIPADLRRRQGLCTGDDVVLVPRAHGLEIRNYSQVLKEAQDVFCGAAPASRVLSDELIAERRSDAALDD
ncbi:MAG: AbrB/MazE/SpoVT family DNA-binding domain-containing protein [Phycisphaerales bacterium]